MATARQALYARAQRKIPAADEMVTLSNGQRVTRAMIDRVKQRWATEGRPVHQPGGLIQRAPLPQRGGSGGGYWDFGPGDRRPMGGMPHPLPQITVPVGQRNPQTWAALHPGVDPGKLEALGVNPWTVADAGHRLHLGPGGRYTGAPIKRAAPVARAAMLPPRDRRPRITEDDPRWNAGTMGNRTGRTGQRLYVNGNRVRRGPLAR